MQRPRSESKSNRHIRSTSLPELSARSYAFLSIGAALITLVPTLIAARLTGSIGLLSQAAELVINLVAALVALWALTIAVKPPDEEHAYGHFKAEYFSSGLESALIVVAALGIGWTAWGRLLTPQPLENISIGVIVSFAGAVINGSLAFLLLRAGKRLRSITLEAEGKHLLTDVWTAAGVLLGIGLVHLSGILALDPLIALAVAAKMVWTGILLWRETAAGLLDAALSEADQQVIERVLARYPQYGIQFHALRTRRSGQRRFISMHVLVPSTWTVQRGHDLCEQVETDLTDALPQAIVFTHLEPISDTVSFADQTLDHAHHIEADD